MALKVIDRFTTRDGIWDAEGRRYGITVEALVKYGHWDIPGKGGASHIFVHYKPGSQVHFRTEGNNSVIADRTTDNSGWCNLPLFESSAFWGDDNGPWIVEINGIEVARGLGLPEGYHVSTFLIVDDVVNFVDSHDRREKAANHIQVIVDDVMVFDNWRDK